MNYHKILEKSKDTELIVRKKNASFIENLLKFLNYDFIHDQYKKIVYAEGTPTTYLEKYMKTLFDTYMFLITNRRNLFSKTLLKKFYYLLTMKELDDEISLKIQSMYYTPNDKNPIEKAVDIHFSIYELFSLDSEEVQFIISFMILNYILLSNDIIGIRLLKVDFEQYKEVKKEYQLGNTNEAISFVYDLLENEKTQPLSYYELLEPITLGEICESIQEDKDILSKLYCVKSISVFGSFAKGNNRIDSDIDLMVTFDDDLSFQEKRDKTDQLKELLFYKFKRFIDIHEFNKYISENMITSIKDYKNIF